MTSSSAFRVFALATIALVCGSAGLRAQAQPPAAPAPPRVQAPPAPPAAPEPARAADKPLVPLKVQITITRSQNNAVTSRLPFTLWVNANSGSETVLSAGISVPVRQSGDLAAPVNYHALGTNITCRATTLDDGGFSVTLSVNDSNIAPGKDATEPVTIRSISARNTLLLRDGQVAEFATSTDKVTGEVTRMEIVASMLK
jgi:hypothetical protein